MCARYFVAASCIHASLKGITISYKRKCQRKQSTVDQHHLYPKVYKKDNIPHFKTEQRAKVKGIESRDKLMHPFYGNSKILNKINCSVQLDYANCINQF
jgi:hypothetical protein